MDEDLLVGAVDPEHIVVVDDGLGTPQEQITLIIQGHVENGEQIALQHGLEIDQHIPAADQVQLAEGRILEHVVLGKDDHLPDVVVDHVFISLAGKVSREPRRQTSSMILSP